MTEKNEKDWSRRGALTGLAAAAGAAGTIPLLGYLRQGADPPAKGGTPPIGGAKASRAKLTGRIVRPDEPAYASASMGWDELFVHHPLVIVFARRTQDVVNALTWARQNDVAPRVRSGRHHLEGWSNVDNGIVIDVSELKSVHVDTASRVATVGAGLNQGEAVAALSAKNLGVTTGTEASVGLAGATLGGGFGFLARYLGMACDNVLVDGTEAEARKLLAPILSTGAPTVTVKRGGWGDIYAGFQVPTPQEPANWKFYSQFIAKPYPKAAIDVVRAYMENAPSDSSNYFTQAFGTGAQAREPRGGSAFPHRNVLFYAEPGAGWGTRGKPGGGDAITPKAQVWIAEFGQAMRPYVSGAYVNVPNIAMANWETAYWGSNFSRLRKIKTKYDPHNVFQYEQSVPPL
jgi:hypothetical protein